MQPGAEGGEVNDRQRTGDIVRTGLALVSVQGLTWLSSLIGVLVVPRFLGAEHFGLSATATTTVMVLGMFAGFGTQNLLIKETARNPQCVRALVVHAVAWRLVVWAALLGIGSAVLLLLGERGTFLAVLALATLAGTFPLVQSALFAGLQGIGRLGKAALVASALGLAGNAGLVLLLVSGGGVVAMTGWLACVAGTTMAATILLFVQLTTGRVEFSLETIRSVAMAGPPYMAWELGLLLYGAVDLFLLSLLTDAGTVGNYAFAYRLIGIPVFASTIITMAVYPALSASGTSDPVWFKSLVTSAARFAFFVTAPMAVGLAVLAHGATEVLSGGGFSDAPILVTILALHIPPAALHTALGMALFARDSQKRMAVLAWIATGFNIGGNLLAIPLADGLWGNGAIGAAVATVATEALMGVFIWRWAWKLIDKRSVRSSIFRTLVASGVMGMGTVVVDAAVGFWPAVAAGILIYAGASLMLGAISVGELRRLRGHAREAPTSVSAEPQAL